MKEKFSLGLIQSSYTHSMEENIQKNIKNIKEAKKRGAELICLSELHNTIYFCQKEDVNFFEFAETIPGKSTELYLKVAKSLKVHLLISLFEKRDRGIYHNTALLIDENGNIAGKYRKMHIPDDPGFYEKFYFTPGDTGFTPVETSLGRIGILVCWDQWFCEPARILALKGAEIIVYPTAIGWDPTDSDEEKNRQLDSWITVQRGHAIENGIFIAAINRVGNEKITASERGINFWGNSFVCGPQGEIIAKASDSKEEIIVAEIDKSRIENVRRIWPFFRDRRIDAFEEILKRYML